MQPLQFLCFVYLTYIRKLILKCQISFRNFMCKTNGGKKTALREDTKQVIQN